MRGVLLQTLLPGKPATRLFVDTNATQYFEVDVTDITHDLIISLTPLSGDPDLLVSTRSPFPHCVFHEAPSPVFPNADCVNFTWSAKRDRQDVLQIIATEPCAHPPAEADCQPSDWRAGVFYIGVFGYSASMYDINVAVRGPNALIPGQYLTSTTSSAAKSFFQLQVRTCSGVSVPATPRPSF